MRYSRKGFMEWQIVNKIESKLDVSSEETERFIVRLIKNALSEA